MSSFSDIESVISLGNNKRLDADSMMGNPKSAPIHPEFAFTDGNIEIQTADQTFWVHEYHLNKFSVFATLVKMAKRPETVSEPNRRTVLICEQKIKGMDVYNALKVVYASHIEGIPNFDSNTMISALRIASVFDYPGLRKLAISKLEKMKLPLIQRIQLSDEFLLTTWETPAFTELCSRAEPVSPAEAEVLGMARFVEIARIREIERTRWAVDFATGVNADMQKSGNSNSQDNPEYSSNRSSLPPCKCSVKPGKPDLNPLAPPKVDCCEIHKVAPKVLKEGQQLLKQRNELHKQLENIRSTVKSRLEREVSSLNLDVPDLKTELARASWIRREGTIVS
ncbi:unnamed protein product [Rhizoctonia solani]|uniref:BTB domain-containing protein n=1 Tax=Rhizoctonia solani TaxID=456999 RepID=A0A8H3GJQ0_9AGAM|nr:unnamed protein product [Rhizoctonia solani]